jgi:hypothetical protein
MTDNERAAIAAGLWEPHLCEAPWWYDYQGQICMTHGKRETHNTPAPDMHDPANLWRALENRPSLGKIVVKFDRDDMFGLLVALYDAEHRE